MRSSIQPKKELPEADRQALRTLTRAVYPPDETADDPENQIAWADTTWSVLVWDDQENLVSHVGAVARTGLYDGKSVLIGGIGGVKTAPSARGNGYAGAGLLCATEYLRDVSKVDFLLLVCRAELLDFYGRFGWQHFDGVLLVEQPAGKVQFTTNESMVLAGIEDAPQGGILDLCGMPW